MRERRVSMLHLCILSYQKTTSSTGTKATCWEEHIYLHDVCLAYSLKPQLHSWRWFSRFDRMVVKIDCQVLSQLLKASSSNHCSWWFLSTLIFRAFSSLYCHPLVCAWVPSPWWHPMAPSGVAELLLPLSLLWLWPHSLCDTFGPPLSLKKDATRADPSLEGSRCWTLWREDFWCFVSFRAKENRLIKTSGLREVLAAASHIGFMGWILFSLGFQIFLSYCFFCHILFLLSYTHCLCLPFGKTFLQSCTSSVQ